MAANTLCPVSTKTMILTFGCLLTIMGFGKAIIFSINLVRSDNYYSEQTSKLMLKNETGESDCLVGGLSEEGAEELHIKTSAEVFANVVKVFMGLWVLYLACGMQEQAVQAQTASKLSK